MKRINLCASAAIFWALLAAPSSSSGASLVLPAGLNPGDQYRIAFLTSDVRDGTSASIADYDLFVTGEANAAGSVLQPLGTTWQAIVSTLTVDAFTHIGGNFSVPVYGVNGLLVASNASDMWDGGIDHPIDVNQFGIPFTAFVNTGTDTNGAIRFGLGAPPFGGGPGAMTIGLGGVIGPGWVVGGQEGNIAQDQFYGISGILTVGGAAAGAGAPEPGTLGLMMAGAMLVLGTKRYRYRRTQQASRMP
jgi:hypothetical protein